MWFLHHFASGSPVYSVPSAFHLSGALHAIWLEQALNAVVARHDTLRTTFTLENDTFDSNRSSISEIELHCIDLEGDIAGTRRAVVEHCPKGNLPAF